MNNVSKQQAVGRQFGVSDGEFLPVKEQKKNKDSSFS